MNHDEDDDLYFVDPCGWQFAVVCALVAVLLVLGFAAMDAIIDYLVRAL
jgi:hypothetical protein